MCIIRKGPTEPERIYHSPVIVIKQFMEFTAILSVVPAVVTEAVEKRKIPNVPLRFVACRYNY
jgi:hypothetical protein